MQLKETAAVIWDMDGTLVDTAELHFQAWVELAEEIGKPFTRADFADTFGWRNPEIIPRLFGSHYSAVGIQELGDRKEEHYRKKALRGVDLLPGARALFGRYLPLLNFELYLGGRDMVKEILFRQGLIGSPVTRRPGASAWPRMRPLLDALLAEYDLTEF